MSAKLNKIILVVLTMMVLAIGVSVSPSCVCAAENSNSVEKNAETIEESSDDGVDTKALAAGLVVGLAALGGAIGMGITGAKANEGISRQPEAESKIRSSMMLGLVFIETAIIYALIVAILIIFVM